MSMLRQSLFTGVLALIALPASAQISADDLWKSWQSLSTEMGYTLSAADVSRDGDRLVAKDVTFTGTTEDMASKSTIAEVVLLETGGNVEVTTSPEWLSETTVQAEGKPQTVNTTFSQTGYLVTVSGSVEEPAYKMSADSFSFAQKMPITAEDGTSEGTLNTSGTLTAMTGDFAMSQGEPRKVSYSFGADTLRAVVKTDATTDGTRASFTFDIEKMTSTFNGDLPKVDFAETDLSALLKMGLQGTSTGASGPLRYSVDVVSPEMPFKGEGGFASTNTSFAMANNQITFELDLNGIEVGAPGATPSASDLAIDGEASLNAESATPEEAFKAGKVTISLTDSQALLDKLTQAGLVPADQMMGVQMMMAMFTKPGEKAGSITSTIEVTETGDFLVNGQSMQ